MLSFVPVNFKLTLFSFPLFTGIVIMTENMTGIETMTENVDVGEKEIGTGRGTGTGTDID